MIFVCFVFVDFFGCSRSFFIIFANLDVQRKTYTSMEIKRWGSDAPIEALGSRRAQHVS